MRARDAAGRWLHPDGLCWPACKEILAALEAERRATVEACAKRVMDMLRESFKDCPRQQEHGVEWGAHELDESYVCTSCLAAAFRPEGT